MMQAPAGQCGCLEPGDGPFGRVRALKTAAPDTAKIQGTLAIPAQRFKLPKGAAKTGAGNGTQATMGAYIPWGKFSDPTGWVCIPRPAEPEWRGNTTDTMAAYTPAPQTWDAGVQPAPVR